MKGEKKQQGLDDMLHAVLLIQFDEFIVILYQQEKISLLSGKVEFCVVMTVNIHI